MIRLSLLAVFIWTFRVTAFADPELMFPPAPEAKSSVDFDGKGFTVNGQRTFIASGSIHYPRVPQELWHDRLLRMKRAGFSTVQSYIFWNLSEPKEGQYNFTGQADFEKYLKEAQDVGLYATVRVGPYVCAEWDSGGFPVWLKFKPGLEVRQHNAPYETAQDAWLAKMLPMIASHQVNKGGNVILVQLENEGAIQGAWNGPTSGDAYFDNIRADAIKGGIQVPSFMSGYNHGSVPWLDNPDNSARQCPWISTEIWAGWYNSYGQTDYSYLRIVRCNDYLLARGAGGLNYYMVHGGTNFDSWNDDENPASYDYAATIGESGELRPTYYTEKENNLFATSFADILCNATYALPEYTDYVKNAFITGARKSPSGTVVFAEGRAGNTDPALVKSIATGNDVGIHIPALESCKLVLDYPIIPAAKMKIAQAITNILGIARNGSTTTLVVFGKPGDTNEITLDIDGAKKTIPLTYSDSMPVEAIEKAGDQTLRILSLSRDLADRSWIVGKPNEQYVVVGPEYCGDFLIQDGKPSLTIERPYGHPAPSQVIVYGPAETPAQHLAVVSDNSIDTAPAPALTDWQMSVPTQSSPSFDDSAWKSSDDPLPMGADGDISAFAWYRTTVQSPQAGSGTLTFHGAADHLVVFINGKRVTAKPSIVDPKPSGDDLKAGNLSWQVTADFVAGKNAIAVLATHQGRDKGPKSGPIDHYFEKGIFKPVDLQIAGQTVPLKGWKMQGGLPDPATLSYQAVAAVDGPAFYHATFTAPRPSVGADPMLRFDTSALSRGTIFLNGHCLGRYPSTIKSNADNKPVGMYLPECWFAADGKNTLVVFDEEGKSPVQSPIQVEKAASREIIAVSKPADNPVAFQLPPSTRPDMRNSAQVNAATDLPVTVSSSAPMHDAIALTAGDPQGWWSPATEPTDDKPAIINLDLQKPRNIIGSEITWQGDADSFPYRVEGSVDGKTWVVLADKWTTHSTGGRTMDRFTNGTGIRYMRMTIGKSTNPERKLGIREWRAWDVYHNG